MTIVTDNLLAALSDNDRAIVELHATGLALEKVARKLRVGKQRVRTLINRLGLARHSITSDKVPKATPEQVEEVLRLYGADASYYAVALQTNISASQCRRIVAHYKPEIARTKEQQHKLSGPPQGYDFRPAHLGLRRHKPDCAACGIEFVVPTDVSDEAGRACGLCAYFNRPAA